jgi:hypothetical protein
MTESLPTPKESAPTAVEAKHLANWEWQMIVGFCVVWPVGFLLLFLFVGFYHSLLEIGLTAFGVLLGPAAGVWVIGLRHVTELQLSADGVRLRTWVRTTEVPWASLRPLGTYPKGSPFQIGSRTEKGMTSLGYVLSKEQGVALLTYPLAPSSLFPPEAWATVGLPYRAPAPPLNAGAT